MTDNQRTVWMPPLGAVTAGLIGCYRMKRDWHTTKLSDPQLWDGWGERV